MPNLLRVTLLTTRKMSPELAARVTASVRGGRARPGMGRKLTPGLTSLLRLSLLIALVLLAGGVVLTRQRTQQRLERDREALLLSVRQESSSLTPEQMSIAARTQSWIERLNGDYAGDHVEEELRPEAAWDAALKKPLLYIRGPIDGFKDAAAIAQTARESAKDALVYCLVQPPESRSETALLRRARATYTRGAQAQDMAHVQRLHAALVGLPYLDVTWQKYVTQAPDQFQLAKLAKLFAGAPVEPAKHAARSELLMIALDEPGQGSAELDGERPHSVRVALVDLKTSRWLLRLRRPVDPSAFSIKSRIEHAAHLDSCSLALSIRETVIPALSAQR